MSGTQTLPIDELETMVGQALTNANVAPANAASVARALVAAEVDGQKGHGLSRVASYAAQAASGKVDGHAAPKLTQIRPASIVIDACHGFAYPAFDLAIEALPAIARNTGIAAAAITRSHHAGVLGMHVERLADAGLLVLAFANTPKAMAPCGGKIALMGTNPIAFAAPRRNDPPIVIDLALSGVARGKIMLAAQKGQSIPEGWALDEQGQPTTDPVAAMKGTLLPLGGAKGAALALMVEIIAVALTGANFAFEASSFFDGEGNPPGVGQVLIAIDPAGFSGADIFHGRLELMARMIAKDDGARLPGTRVVPLREKAKRDGLTLDAAILKNVKDLARQQP